MDKNISIARANLRNAQKLAGEFDSTEAKASRHDRDKQIQELQGELDEIDRGLVIQLGHVMRLIDQRLATAKKLYQATRSPDIKTIVPRIFGQKQPKDPDRLLEFLVAKVQDKKLPSDLRALFYKIRKGGGREKELVEVQPKGKRQGLVGAILNR